MNRSLSTLMIAAGAALTIGALAGCDGAPKESLSDALAQDSSLNLMVMTANLDSVSVPSADTGVESSDAEVNSDNSAPVVPSVSDANTPQSTPRMTRVQAASAPAEVYRAPAARLATRREATVLRQVQAAHAPVRASAAGRTVARSSTPRQEVSSPRMVARTSGSVSAGAELALVAGQRICTFASRVGDEFAVILAEPVTGTNGMVIPRGATAVAEIASIGRKKDGRAAIGLRVESITVSRRTYPIDSRVTFAELEQQPSERRGRFDACIPERGQINARLTTPLDIARSE